MIKKLLLTFLALLAVVGTLVGIYVSMITTLIAAAQEMTAPPEVVSSSGVQELVWRPVFHSIGSVTAVQGVELSVEQAGLVSRIAFDSGDAVKQGEVLVELDNSSEQAQLRAAEAAYKLTDVNLKRARELRANNTIPQSDLDAAEARAAEAEAQVANLKAVIAKKTLRAPFAGQLGLRRVNLGQYLNPGASVVSLQSTDSVYVDFSVPQQQLGWIRKGLEVQVTFVEGQPPVTGKITALESAIDPDTRNLRIQATLENKQGVLKPGMFVNVSVLREESRKVLAVPATAILYASYGNSLYVVENNEEGQRVVNQHFVRIGEAKGDFVEILDGVKPGDEVVSAGAFKLRNGMVVEINNANPLKPELNPNPKDS